MRTLVLSSLVILAAAAARPYAQTSTAPQQDRVRQIEYLKASNPAEMQEFGFSVAVSGDGATVAVGAPHENTGDLSAAGAVYVFTRNGRGWVQQGYLKASTPGQYDEFGSVVALSADGNTLAVGAQFEDSGAGGINGNQADESISESGAVYVFTRRGAVWSQQAYIKASNPGDAEDGDTFGFSLAVSDDGNTLAVGAPSEDSSANGVNGNQLDNSAASAGAAYVFVRSGKTWTQQAYIKSDAPARLSAGDLFGYSVALSANGDVLAVGAYDEAGSSTTVNGPIDGETPGSGAIYVFARRGAAWTRDAYLKASTQDRGDSLGAWVALSDDGRTLAAGAMDEDTPAGGINAIERGNSDLDLSIGAAYVFARSAGGWLQQASFKASNAGKQDWFGVKLALSGDGNTLAVSAPNEDSGAHGIGGNGRDESASEAGAVYLFRRNGSAWRQAAYVKASNSGEFDEFGSAVGLDASGSLLAVGAHFEDGGAPDSGAVYLFGIDRVVESR